MSSHGLYTFLVSRSVAHDATAARKSHKASLNLLLNLPSARLGHSKLTSNGGRHVSRWTTSTAKRKSHAYIVREASSPSSRPRSSGSYGVGSPSALYPARSRANAALASYNVDPESSWTLPEMLAATTLLCTTMGIALGASQAMLGYTPNEDKKKKQAPIILENQKKSAVEASSAITLFDCPTELGILPSEEEIWSTSVSLKVGPNQEPVHAINKVEVNSSAVLSGGFSKDQASLETFDVSVRALKGRRLSMEDEYVISDGGRFVAVFDGHGGSGVSRYLRESLYRRFLYFLGEVKDESQDVLPPSGSGNYSFRGSPVRSLSFLRRNATSPDSALSITHQMDALRSAFRAVEREVLSDDRFHYMGSTAVAVSFYGTGKDKSIVVANIGDSRAVLSSGKKAVNLTKDHKPNDQTERSRIVALGEKVEWDGYVHRVLDLSLSRAIGDRFAKPVVSSNVDIAQHRIREDDEFIILASDGLWDVMSSQEAVTFIHEKMSNFDDGLASQLLNVDIQNTDVVNTWKRKQMSRFLANEAMRRGTLDNVCVIVVWIKKEDQYAEL